MRTIFGIVARWLNFILEISESSIHGDRNGVSDHATREFVFFGQVREIDVLGQFDLFWEVSAPNLLAQFCGQDVEIDLHRHAAIEGRVEDRG